MRLHMSKRNGFIYCVLDSKRPTLHAREHTCRKDGCGPRRLDSRDVGTSPSSPYDM